MSTHKFFNKLNYTLANEDTKLEYDLLDEGTNHVLTIAGSGSRVLPLFAKKPKKISIADYSAEQLALTNTRIESVRQLTYPQFLAFWGYPTEEKMSVDQRKAYLKDFCLEGDNYELMFNIFDAYNWMHSLIRPLNFLILF